jgi:cytochrome c oxidase assembly protein subunit 15
MKLYVNYTRFLIVWVFLVITAGSIVRMTQSGMGCPDWPTCFGKWIPPTNESQLPADFEKYLKQQDIDHTFNAFHTWVEYLNRLLGALLGIWIIVFVIFSFRKFYNEKPMVFWLSLLLLIAVAFEAWLGKTVVDANLAVVKVSGHMLAALFIAAIPVFILQKISGQQKIKNNWLKWVTNFTIVLLLCQIILGTDVRQQIDVISKSFNYTMRPLWINQLNKIFIIHRSFSWFVAIGVTILLIRSYAIIFLKVKAAINAFLVLALMILGITMVYFGMPAFAQPLHVLCSSILIINLFSFRLRLE